jgi:NitT/TauT family transport system substrate-binding protein
MIVPVMNPPLISRGSALLYGGAALCAIALPARAQSTASIRLGIQPLENAMEVYYAQDTGRSAAAGLDIEIQTIQAVAAIEAAVVSGALDIGYGTVDTLATAHQKGIPLTVVAPASEYVFPGSERISAVVVTANSPIREAKDLNGKIVSSAGLRSLGETATRAWVDRNGGDSSTIRFVELPFPAVGAALAAGRIDAGFMPEPFLSARPSDSRVLAYAFDAVAKRFLLSAFFTTAQWAKDHPDAVHRFAALIHDTAIWANANPDLTGPIVAKYAKLDPTVVAAMARTRYGETLTPAVMQPLIDVSAKYNDFKAFPAQELIAR